MSRPKGPQTAESRAKASASHMGKVVPPEVRAKISKNSPRYWLGRTLTEETRRRMSAGMKGRVPWNKGTKGAQKPISDAGREQRRQRLLGVRVGSKNPMWRGGVTPLRVRIWRSSKYRDWRKSIFKQDNYTCRFCGAHSGNGVAVRLEADHFPIPFAVLLRRVISTNGPEHLLEAALADVELWAAEGRTLCHRCHNTTKRGRFTISEHLRAKEFEWRYAGHQ